MFWIILVAAILIGSVVLAIIWRDEDFVFFGVLTAFLVGLIGAGVFFLAGCCFTPDEVYETNETDICALTDNTGTFFVGRYHSDSSIFYSYLEETDDGGKVVGKIDAKDAILYDDEKEQPYIVEFKKHNSNPFVRFFFCTDRTKYEIHIPPESIRYDYSVDLK